MKTLELTNAELLLILGALKTLDRINEEQIRENDRRLRSAKDIELIDILERLKNDYVRYGLELSDLKTKILPFLDDKKNPNYNQSHC